jgi:hypothetical protein
MQDKLGSRLETSPGGRRASGYPQAQALRPGAGGRADRDDEATTSSRPETQACRWLPTGTGAATRNQPPSGPGRSAAAGEANDDDDKEDDGGGSDGDDDGEGAVAEPSLDCTTRGSHERAGGRVSPRAAFKP